MMRIRLAIFSVLMLPAISAAQQRSLGLAPKASADIEAHQDQVQAATDNAAANLREQILRTRLTRDLTVEDFLNQTNKQSELTRVLKGAQPVGGPRWVDDHTCQIQLELPESQVGAMLMGIAHTPGQNSPIRPETLKAKFNEWSRLKFSAMGSSAGGEAIESAKPHDSAGKWLEVDDASRRTAIAHAKSDADEQLLQTIGPVTLSNTVHTADALTRPLVTEHFNNWLHRQPVTRIEFLDNLKVSVTISIAPKSMSRALKSAVLSDDAFSRPMKIDWDCVAQQIKTLPNQVEGTATVAIAVPATTLPSVVLPLQSPDWVEDQLQADGSANGGGARLKVVRAAEANAVEKIRHQFLQLRIDPNTTLGDAARTDPQLNQAIDHALLHTHTYRVNYLADGSAKVQVDLDLRAAWDALRSNQ